jgi:membrane associated rhomboid family serine protease
MGHGRFLGLYLLSGVAGALAGAWMSSGLSVPIVGAGAAVAGVAGAYFVLFRIRASSCSSARGEDRRHRGAALLIAAFWAVLQIVGDGGRLIVSAGDSAFILWSHVAGAATGAVAVWIFRRPERQSVEWWSASRFPPDVSRHD